MDAVGRRTWVIPGGHVPLDSSGPEPAMTSHDLLAVLNTSDEPVQVEVWIHHTDGEPVGPCPLQVAARRVRRVRVNDLIDPRAVPLGIEYALVVRASAPVVVQFTRQDTTRPAAATMGTIAFPA